MHRTSRGRQDATVVVIWLILSWFLILQQPTNQKTRGLKKRFDRPDVERENSLEHSIVAVVILLVVSWLSIPQL